MARPQNDLDCKAFSEAQFAQEVWKRSSGQAGPAPFTPPQVSYLAAHLLSLGASTLVVESHYIDRHYIEEVGLYYSRCLSFGRNACARLHAFRALADGTQLHDGARLDELLSQAVGGGAAAENLLRSSYLGYVVVRPQPSVPIGRTVLRPEGASPATMNAWVQSRYGAHVMGMSLKVEGLAFQQQDRAVGACATTAVWTALQQTCKRESDRPPTPSAITQAAVRYSVPEGRALPSTGLTLAQICEAFRSFEFPPDVFAVNGDPPLFKIRLNTYVRSGMPVLLAIRGPGGGHAVTVAGFRASSGTPPVYTVQGQSVESVNLASDQVFVHDDRIGPYAKAEMVETTELTPAGPQQVLKLRLWDHSGVVEEPLVLLAAAPLYPKLRSTADELLEASLWLLPIIQPALAGAGQLRLKIFFQRSGEYLASLYSLPVDPTRLTAFQRKIALSRYVGVSRWRLGDDLVVDSIWDTTDTLRKETLETEFLLGLVSFRPSDHALVDQIAKHAGAIAG